MKRTLLVLAIALSTSLAAVADDALPLFWVLGFETFMWGALWVVISETAYCRFKIEALSLGRTLASIVLANTVTTFFGLIWMVIAPPEIGLALVRGFNGKNYEALNHLPSYQVYGVLIALLIGYFSSFIIEAVPFWLLTRRQTGMRFMQALKHSIIFNGVSYLGLVCLYLGVVRVNWGKGP